MKNKHEHKEGFECEACRDGAEAVRERERKAMEKMGWYVHFVPGDKNFPYDMNVHTHGVEETFKHPDIQICAGLPSAIALSILTTAVEDYIRKGKEFKAGKFYDGLIKPAPDLEGVLKMEVLFLEATENGRPVLRMILPGKLGEFSSEFPITQTKDCTIPDTLKSLLSGEYSGIN
jgi:hypothetical protein